MALAALVVAITSALISAGTLLHSILSFRREGWKIDVNAWWDYHDKQIHVQLTNVGRQACVISEIRYIINGRTSSPDATFFDYDAVPEPIAPSATIEITKNLKNLPAAFTLDVEVWTAGRPYKSERWIQSMQPETQRWVRSMRPQTPEPEQEP